MQEENKRVFNRMEDLERRLYGLPPYDAKAHLNMPLAPAAAFTGSQASGGPLGTENTPPDLDGGDVALAELATEEAGGEESDALIKPVHLAGKMPPQLQPAHAAGVTSEAGGVQEQRPGNRLSVRFSDFAQRQGSLEEAESDSDADGLTLYGSGAILPSPGEKSATEMSAQVSADVPRVAGSTVQFRALQQSALDRLEAMKGMRLASLLAAYLMRHRGEDILRDVTHTFRLNGRKQRRFMQSVSEWTVRKQRAWQLKLQQLQLARNQLLMYFPADADAHQGKRPTPEEADPYNANGAAAEGENDADNGDRHGVRRERRKVLSFSRSLVSSNILSLPAARLHLASLPL